MSTVSASDVTATASTVSTPRNPNRRSRMQMMWPSKRPAQA
jgi:hypothetical protein